ncbi:MAG: hypothetical protein KF763_09725 [Cyclobacteriaceae bacterium]|nr:hypothetical protein [Cyclobacteriaceae bacterium]
MKGFLVFTCFLFSLKGISQQSTFDTDADGWTALDSNTSSTPAYQSTGGNPRGFIQVFDGVLGTATFYVVQQNSWATNQFIMVEPYSLIYRFRLHPIAARPVCDLPVVD